MKLPNFLIVGAMKAGTTTLYADLGSHPDIFLTSDKEPNGLLWCGDERGHAQYCRLFQRAGSARARGEASTFYTKRPASDGLAEMARKVLGSEVQIIYLVREPIQRLLSQYRHQVGIGEERRPIELALSENPAYLNFSRYAWQIAPWKEAFGKERVHVFKFENYVSNRKHTVVRVCDALGVDPQMVSSDFERVHNKTAGKPTARGIWAKVIRARTYRDQLRPIIPARLRDALKLALLPRNKDRISGALTSEMEAELRAELSPEDISLWKNSQ